MPKDINKILGESANLPGEMQEQILEAWDQKLVETREEITSELREEFARKFKHDKKVFVESVDSFLNDKIRAELVEFAEDKKVLAKERLAYKRKVAEHATMLNTFLTKNLAKEVKELHSDKANMKESFGKLENFMLKQLAGEIREFRQDKKGLVEQRVKMVSEGKKQLQQSKAQFIKRASKVVEATINRALNKEITQFKEDIQESRKNDFGRRIFEAFVGEYMTSHLNEGTEVSKLQQVIESKDTQLKQLYNVAKKKDKLAENLEVKLSAAKDRVSREKKLNELLGPLGKDKKAVMRDLLESTQTVDLEKAYSKYLPAVLNESKPIKRKTHNRQNIQEAASRSEKTGNRPNAGIQREINQDFDNEIAEIKALAGLK